MITLTAKGNFNRTDKFLQRLLEFGHASDLDKYGRMGVDALRKATPKDTGKTADSWGYVIHHNGDHASIEWTNSNIQNGVPIAIIIQYGHGTGWGKYVEGIDYINPAMRPVFNKIADMVWEEVTKA